MSKEGLKKVNFVVLSIVLVLLLLAFFYRGGIINGGVIGVSWFGNLFGAGKITGNAVNLEDGLVAYYNFEGDIKDRSGEGNDGVNNGVTFIDGKSGLGKSGKFSGKEYVALGGSTNLVNLVYPVSISFWAKPEEGVGDGSRAGIVFSFETINLSSQLVLGEWGESLLVGGPICSGGGYSVYPNPVSGDTWGMWTMVINSSGSCIFYFNGKYAPQFSNGIFNRGGMELGARSKGTEYPFNGSIDELRIYNRALSGDEIRDLYGFRESITPVVNETVIPENFTEENESEMNESEVNETAVNVTIPEVVNKTVIPENKSGEWKEKVPENKSNEIVKECKLVGARWEKEKADAGERVKLVLEAENCEGKFASFKIEEYDDLSSNDDVEGRLGDVIIENGRAETYWNAEWQCDGARVFGECIGGKPEYKFTVSVNPEIESSNLLSVSEAGGRVLAGQIPAPLNFRVRDVAEGNDVNVELTFEWYYPTNVVDEFELYSSNDGQTFSRIQRVYNESMGVDGRVVATYTGDAYGVKRWYKVRAKKGGEFSDYSETLSFVTLTWARDLVAQTQRKDRAELNWSFYSKHSPPFVPLGFHIWRSDENNPSSFQIISSVSLSSRGYYDYSVQPGLKYFYKVSAYYPEGDSAFSNGVSIAPGKVPDAPSLLVVNLDSSVCTGYNTPGVAGIAWADNSNNILGWLIERSTDGSNWQLVYNKTINTGTLEVYDNNGYLYLNPDTLYHYRVRGYNQVGMSENIYVDIKTPPAIYDFSNVNWYVDTVYKGTASGDSWANAWGIDSINWCVIKPGDNVYLDGGLINKTYTKSLVISKHGEVNKPVSFLTGALAPNNAGHSGRVIFNNGIIYIPRDAQWIVIDGAKNSSFELHGTESIKENINLEVGYSSNSNCFLAYSPRNLKLRWAELHDCYGTGVTFNPNGPQPENVEVAYSWIHHNWAAGINSDSMPSGSVFRYGDYSYHHNIIEWNHDDAFQVSPNTDIYNNILRHHALPEVGHPDGVQTGSSCYMRIYNNIFQTPGTPIYGGSGQEYCSNFMVYNNVIYPDSLATQNVRLSIGCVNLTGRCHLDKAYFDNVLIANNIIANIYRVPGILVPSLYPTPLGSSSPYALEVDELIMTNFTIANNIVYNVSPLFHDVSINIGGNFSDEDVVFSNNLISGPNKQISFRNQIYANPAELALYTNYKNNYQDTRSEPLVFVDAPFNDFHLALEDSAAVDRGIDLSAFEDEAPNITKDLEGNPRGIGTGWDIGAYELQGCTDDSPHASYITGAREGYAPLIVEFNASRSLSCSGEIVSYSWDFGDGISFVGKEATHTYDKAGAYQAKLTIVNSAGKQDSISKTILARPEAQRGLLLWLNFDENDGITRDWSEKQHDVASAESPLFVTGVRGKGAVTGTGGRVYAVLDGNSPDLKNIPMITISMWTKMDIPDFTTLVGGYFIEKPGLYGIAIKGNTQGATGFIKGLSSPDFVGGWENNHYVYPYADLNWHHYALTYNGSLSVLYIDGAEKARSTEMTGLIGAGNNPALFIGGGAGRLFNGSIDEVLIYDRALNSSEIRTLFELNYSAPPMDCASQNGYLCKENEFCAGDYLQTTGERLLCCSVQCQRAEINDLGLVLNINFEDSWSDDLVMNDASGNGNDAHISRTDRIATKVNGVGGGNAAEFHRWDDGLGEDLGGGVKEPSGEYAYIKDSNTLNNLNEATISVWAYYNAANDFAKWGPDKDATLLGTLGYIEGEGYTVGSWSIGRYFSSVTRFVLYNDSIGNTDVLSFPDDFSSSNGASGGWHHYAVTFDGETSTFIAYYDGKRASSLTSPVINKIILGGLTRGEDNKWIALSAWTHFGTYPWQDPGDSFPNNGWMNGKIDEVRIYNRALSPIEIFALANFWKLNVSEGDATNETLVIPGRENGGNGGGGSGGGNGGLNNIGNGSNIYNPGGEEDKGINVTKIIEGLGGGNTPIRRSIGTVIFVGIMAALVGGIVFLSVLLVRRIKRINFSDKSAEK